jgi:hypothetical protein
MNPPTGLFYEQSTWSHCPFHCGLRLREMMAFENVLLRMLSVLAASTLGLVGGSLIHYVFLDDWSRYHGSPIAARKGTVFFVVSILFFLAAVWVLYLNRFPAAVVAFLGMLLSKLVWNIADSYRYAGRIHTALKSLNGDGRSVREFLQRSRTFRQVQDLRSAARATFVPGSPQLRSLEDAISDVLGPNISGASADESLR